MVTIGISTDVEVGQLIFVSGTYLLNCIHRLVCEDEHGSVYLIYQEKSDAYQCAVISYG